MMTDLSDHLRLKLEADGKPGLYELYQAASGALLGGRFRLGLPCAAGQQALLIEAVERSTGRPVLVKQIAFDYRRPIQYSRAKVASLRHLLWQEHQVLQACTTGHLPEPIALLTSEPVVPAAAESNVLGRGEVFLIEERIDARTLDVVASSMPAEPAVERELLARRVAREYLRFWTALQAAGYHYGDLNTQNILVESGTGKVRMVDAACVVAAGPSVVVREFTPAFLTPRLHEAMTEGRPVPGSLASVLPVLSKVLHHVLTGRVPWNGQMPDWHALDLALFSPQLRKALRCMAEVDGDEARLPDALGLDYLSGLTP
jgi:hypothetical protein